jgi:hypothetical protein
VQSGVIPKNIKEKTTSDVLKVKVNGKPSFKNLLP